MSDQADRKLIRKRKKAPVPETYLAPLCRTPGGSLTCPDVLASASGVILMRCGDVACRLLCCAGVDCERKKEGERCNMGEIWP